MGCWRGLLEINGSFVGSQRRLCGIYFQPRAATFRVILLVKKLAFAALHCTLPAPGEGNPRLLCRLQFLEVSGYSAWLHELERPK
jgi:hypothetical protein